MINWSNQDIGEASVRIISIHEYRDDHLQTVMNDAKSYGSVELRGIVDDDIDAFLLFEGCHRIEAALRLQIPLVLVDCSSVEFVDIEIPRLEWMFRPVFRDGKSSVVELEQALNWCGKEYEASDFASTRLRPAHSKY